MREERRKNRSEEKLRSVKTKYQKGGRREEEEKEI